MTDTNYRAKGQSLLLAAIMVLSVVAMSTAFVGTVAADVPDDVEGEVNEGISQLNNDERMFQGEVGIVDDAFLNGEDYVDLYRTDTSDDEDHSWIRELVVYNSSAEAADHTDLDVEEINATNPQGGFVVIDSTDLDQGAHHLELNGTNQLAFDIRIQSLTAEFGDETISNVQGQTDLDIDSNRAQFQAGISAEGLDAGDLEDIFNHSGQVFAVSDDEDIVYVNASGSFTANFNEIDAGTYEFEINATDTTAEDTATIEVLDEDISYEFTDIAAAGQGDVANITFQLENTDEAAIQVGVWDDFFYQVGLNVTMDEDYDGQEVGIEMNTYTAGGGGVDAPLDPNNEIVFSTESDHVDNIEVVYRMISADNQLNPRYFGPGETVPAGQTMTGLLPQGSHEVLMGAEWNMSTIPAGTTLVGSDADPQFQDSAEATTFLEITQASAPGDFSVKAVPSDQDVTGLDNLEDATISDAEQLAYGDRLLVEVEDLGLGGIFEYADLNDGDAASAALGAVNITVEMQRDDLPPNADHAWNTSPDPTEPVISLLQSSILNAEDYNGTLLLELDYQNNMAGVPEDPRGFDLTFKADTNTALEEIDSENLVQEDHITIDEAFINFDTGMAQVPNSEEATLSGTTNLAPGSEIRVRAYSAGAFSESDDAVVEVDDEGNWVWSTMLDLSAGSPGAAFDLEAQGPHDASEDMEPTLTQAGEVQPPNFQIDTDVPSSVAPGDDASLGVTVTNIGTEEGDSNYTVMVGGEEVDSEMLTLGAGEEHTGDYSIDTAEEGSVEWEVTTDDDSASGTVEIATPDEPDDGDDGNQSDDGGDEGEGDDTPGFGIAVAIVALLGAAMLALRRQN